MKDVPKTNVIVCADVSGRRKRRQSICDRRWNGRDYFQRIGETDSFLDRVERALTRYYLIHKGP